MRSVVLAYAARIGLAIVVFATFFLAPELVARWLGLEAGWSLRADRVACLQRSPSLLLEFIPGCTGRLMGTPVAINSHSFRSPEIRDDDSRRILMLGDSCTFGWRVKPRRTYPAVLQRLLDKSQPPPGYQVINAGHPGHTAYQGRVLLAERGLALDPYIVTVAFGFNALFKEGDIEERIEAEAARHLVFSSDDFLMSHSRLYAWARWKMRPDATTEAYAESPEKYAANLRAIVSLARDSGAKVMFISFWNKRLVRTCLICDHQPARLRAEFVEVARELSVPVVRYSGPVRDYVHPTVKGYRTLGRRVFEAIEEQGWLESPVTSGLGRGAPRRDYALQSGGARWRGRTSLPRPPREFHPHPDPQLVSPMHPHADSDADGNRSRRADYANDHSERDTLPN